MMNVTNQRFFAARGILLLLAFVSIASGLLFCLYRYDNKYTYPCTRIEDGVLEIDDQTFSDQDLLFLIDDWEFYPGQLLSPHALAAQNPVPDHLSIGQYPDFSMREKGRSSFGSATYRITLHNTGTPRVLSLALPEILSASTVWINGAIVQTIGDVQPQSYRPYTKESVVAFYAEETTELVIETSNFSHYYSGVYYPPALGSTDAISRMVCVRLLFYGLLCFLSLGFALFSITVWFASSRKDPLYFWFGFLCVAFASSVSYPFVRSMGVPLAGLLYAAKDLSFHLVLLSAVCISTHRALLRQSKLFRYMILPLCGGFCVAGVAIPLLVLPHAPHLIGIYSILLDIHRFVVCAYLIACGVIAIRRRQAYAYWLLASNAAFAICLLGNPLLTNLFEPIFTGWQSEYAGFLMVLSVAAMLIRRNRDILIENQRLTAHLQEEVSLQTSQLTSLLDERKKFLSNIAHDLKAPVSTIQAYIDLIQEGNIHVDSEMEAFIYAIGRKCNEVQNRVGTLQRFSSQDERPVDMQKICLNELMQTFYSNNQPDIEVNDIDLCLSLPAQKCWIKGDLERLTRALENLVFNAVGYTAAGGQISLVLRIDGLHAIVTVSDNGCGIDAEQLPMLFERFYSNHRNSQSQGLGLYIAKSIVSEHRGEISVDSKVGEGSVFTLRLPLID